MKLAFIYAGQGSQHVGMGMDLYEQYPEFRRFYDTDAAGFNIKEMMENGPEEDLNQTRNTQPCMVAFCTGITALLEQEGIHPEMVAGLSLGEYSALTAAGVFDADTAIALTAFRGKVMETAVGDLPCAMAAIMNLDRDALKQVCSEASSLGIVEIANYNCPGQMVIAGEKSAVEKASELALAAGARRCIPLHLPGPFHSSLMHPAGDALAEYFQKITFGEMKVPVIFNVTAKPLQPDESIPALMERQVQSSTYFEDSIRYMEQAGIDTLVEIGPGKVLAGFVRKTTKNLKTFSVEDVESLRATIEALKGAAQ
ncbi:MAG: ACP S-malonyltransferase [Clostridium sp.]|uniref:ACP S-malonyltransferase n=1 Tax=Clostridium sp. TaxID=1506 RepID=UPI0029087411|nr:ACP S-malonyltransferase [Clostridium sp.]MDU7337082.1 ACP S-malonyltransferase [Clostridium sp.]